MGWNWMKASATDSWDPQAASGTKPNSGSCQRGQLATGHFLSWICSPDAERCLQAAALC